MRPATWLQIVIAYEKGDGNTCMQVLKRLGLSTGILYENNLEAIRFSSILDGSSFVVISVKIAGLAGVAGGRRGLGD